VLTRKQPREMGKKRDTTGENSKGTYLERKKKKLGGGLTPSSGAIEKKEKMRGNKSKRKIEKEGGRVAIGFNLEMGKGDERKKKRGGGVEKRERRHILRSRAAELQQGRGMCRKKKKTSRGVKAPLFKRQKKKIWAR